MGLSPSQQQVVMRKWFANQLSGSGWKKVVLSSQEEKQVNAGMASAISDMQDTFDEPDPIVGMLLTK